MTDASRSARCRARSGSTASTMTRTVGSVPLGRTRILPERPSSAVAAATCAATSREAATRVQGQEAGIYGWHELILNRDERCRDCGEELDQGARAYRGLSDQPDAAPVFLCAGCVGRIGRE